MDQMTAAKTCETAQPGFELQLSGLVVQIRQRPGLVAQMEEQEIMEQVSIQDL